MLVLVDTGHILTHWFYITTNSTLVLSSTNIHFPILKPVPVGYCDHQASSHHHGLFHRIVPTWKSAENMFLQSMLPTVPDAWEPNVSQHLSGAQTHVEIFGYRQRQSTGDH